ncbi:hypothetical protein PAF17_10550 [Paracoccus sp. Z330]|uniref:DUF4237 domain-containing protein n=1 Tax=Paracoccus onchidii TaxID=3017813 RepID=A0ABT4ZEX4_9RHOB|nr:hypothetical protein [Paracoccus onchidii]MDB6177940.1 hypothetical protein [Paracoccus onchidii]
MPLSYPYPLSFFCDQLRVKKCRVFMQRFDESSGSGDGRVWSSELSRPLWSAELSLADRAAHLARDIEARIDGLDGARKTFLFSDPGYSGPQNGITAGLGSVTIDSISSDRSRAAFSGFPPGFELTVGDFFSIAYGADRYYFGRVMEGGGSAGALREVRPYLPLPVSTGLSVELVKPRFKAIIPPGGYQPFDFDLPGGDIARGGSMRIVQKP